MTNLVVNQRPGETTNEQTVKEGESRRKKGERRKCKKVSHIHTYSLFSLSFTHSYPRAMHARVCVCAWQGVKGERSERRSANRYSATNLGRMGHWEQSPLSAEFVLWVRKSVLS